MPDSRLTFRRAERADLEAIVRLLADDPLGSRRERFELPLPPAYVAAFEAINADPNNELIVTCDGAEVIGILQLTYIPNLTYEGSWRAQIEGVRVARDARDRGVGRAMIADAIARARWRGCRLLQLTTDKSRPHARAFYEALGFSASHEGMKLDLRAER